jgi:hypothetical protein
MDHREDAGPDEVAQRVPAELCRLPWDAAKDEMGAEVVDFMFHIAKVQVRLVKDQIGRYLAADNDEIGKVLVQPVKDESGAVPGCESAGAARPAADGPGAPAP